MDLLLDKNELIWAAGLSLALVYFVATYVRLRYCERHVTEYGRLILQTYGRDMHVVPESVLRYYRQVSGRTAVRGGGIRLLFSVRGRACCRFRQLCGLPGWGFRSAGVPCLGA